MWSKTQSADRAFLKASPPLQGWSFVSLPPPTAWGVDDTSPIITIFTITIIIIIIIIIIIS